MLSVRIKTLKKLFLLDVFWWFNTLFHDVLCTLSNYFLVEYRIRFSVSNYLTLSISFHVTLKIYKEKQYFYNLFSFNLI